MKTKETKPEENLQISSECLTDKELVKLVKEAEKGPFYTLEEHSKQMEEWIRKNSR